MTVISVYVDTLTMTVNRVKVGEMQKCKICDTVISPLHLFLLARTIKMSNLV